jgi:hypothetical protein
LLARVRNQLKKITKKGGSDNEEGVNASKKVSEILAVINGRESQESDDFDDAVAVAAAVAASNVVQIDEPMEIGEISAVEADSGAACDDLQPQTEDSVKNENIKIETTPEPPAVSAKHKRNKRKSLEKQNQAVFNDQQQKFVVTLMKMIEKCALNVNQKISDLNNSPKHQHRVQASSINSKIKLVNFIKSIDNEPRVNVDFIIKLIEKLLELESATSNFALMVFMRVFGERLELTKSEKFSSFFDYFMLVSASKKDKRAKVLASLCDFRENGWKVSEYFGPPLKSNDLYCNELLIDFHIHAAAIDEFFPGLWRFLLTSGSNNKLVKLVSKCSKLHVDFTPKLVNFLAARFKTFKNFNPKVYEIEKIRMRLGRVAVFIVQLLKMKLISDENFTMCLTQKLVENIPHEFMTKIMEVVKRTNFSDKQMKNVDMQTLIKKFELIQTMGEVMKE